MTFALIDIGSNTIRLSVYSEGEHAQSMLQNLPPATHDSMGGFVRLFTKKVMAQLASYVDEGNRLTEEGIKRACEALAYLGTICANLGVTEIHAFATASLRNVANRDEAIRRIEAASGLSIELLSGQEEALLGFSSFQHEHPLQQGVVCDIGGGSAEVVCFAGHEPSASASIPLGSLKLYKREVAGLLPTKKEAKAICQRVEGALDAAGFAEPPAQEVLCGIGGTARAVVKVMQQAGMPAQTGQRFPARQLKALLEQLTGDEEQARGLILRACPERVHTLVPGALVLKTIVKRFGVKEMIIGRYGVREGYVYERIIG